MATVTTKNFIVCLFIIILLFIAGFARLNCCTNIEFIADSYE